MRNIAQNTISSILVFGLGLFASTPGQAAEHPSYIHARSDIHLAMLYLHDDPSTGADEKTHTHYARAEAKAALAELDQAIAADHKGTPYDPPIDTALDRPGRIHKAVDLLREARQDISTGESNPQADMWRNAAYKHLDQAIVSCKAAAHSAGSDIQ